MQSKIESLESHMIIQELTNSVSSGACPANSGRKEGGPLAVEDLKIFDKIIKISSKFEFKNIVFHAKSLFPEHNILVYNQD